MTVNRIYHRYVAVGDSFSEGIADEHPEQPGTFIGWTDRLAAQLAHEARQDQMDFGYANLAIRGKLLPDILGDQVARAHDLGADLVSITGGGNDVLRPKVDLDRLAIDLEKAVRGLRETGADVLIATLTDPQAAPVMRWARSRHAVFTAHIWSIARRNNCHVLDMWGLSAIQDRRLWAEDRLHLTSEGHQRVSAAAMAALGFTPAYADWSVPLPPAPAIGKAAWARSNARWITEHVSPWVGRRLTGRSSGDRLHPKRPELTPYGADEPGSGA